MSVGGSAHRFPSRSLRRAGPRSSAPTENATRGAATAVPFPRSISVSRLAGAAAAQTSWSAVSRVSQAANPPGSAASPIGKSARQQVGNLRYDLGQRCIAAPHQRWLLNRSVRARCRPRSVPPPVQPWRAGRGWVSLQQSLSPWRGLPKPGPGLGRFVRRARHSIVSPKQLVLPPPAGPSPFVPGRRDRRRNGPRASRPSRWANGKTE